MIILLMSHKFNGLVTKICVITLPFFTLNEIYLQLYLLGTLVRTYISGKDPKKTKTQTWMNKLILGAVFPITDHNQIDPYHLITF